MADDILIHWVLTIIISVSFILLFLPMQCYYTKLFCNKSKTEILLSRRYPNIIKWICTLECMYLLVQQPIYMLPRASPLTYTHPHVIPLLHQIEFYTYHFLCWGLILLSLLRYWLMFYELNWRNINPNKIWKIHIDPNIEHSSFWLKYKSTLGSYKFMLKITMFLWTIIYVFHCLFFAFYGYDESQESCKALYGQCVFIIPAIVMVILYTKIPSVLDKYHLRYELCSVLCLDASILPIIITITITLIYVDFGCSDLDIKHNQTADISRGINIKCIPHIIRMTLQIIGWNGYLFVITYCMLKKNQSLKQQKPLRKHCQSDHIQNIRTVAITCLTDVLCDKNEFELFGQHCSREVMIETILSLIELTQFKDLIIIKYGHEFIQDQHENGVQLHRLDATETQHQYSQYTAAASDEFYNYAVISDGLRKYKAIPKSYIVFNGDSDSKEGILCIAWRLYQKYINKESSWTLNISDELRSQYVHDMDMDQIEFVNDAIDMEYFELFEYFDPVIEEMYSLLQSSFTRYIRIDPLAITDDDGEPPGSIEFDYD